MRIAVIGTGIAGNVVAHHLWREHDIAVFEANDYVGGHTNTVEVDTADGPLAVDTGFIVFNDRNYPRFTSLLDRLGQPSQPSVMSFSVQSETDNLEYNGASISALFAQRRNLGRPSFYRLIHDILRFNRRVVFDAEQCAPELTIGEYVSSNRYSTQFTEQYLIPMAAAIWSAEPGSVREMPLQFLVRFFEHHGLLSLNDRPQWRVVRGGSRQYVDKLTRGFRDRIRLATPVQWIRRRRDAVIVKAANQDPEHFDHVFIATHSDQALAMLADPSRLEQQVLGAMPYQKNEAVLHTDESVLPKRRRAWAAWNYHIPADRRNEVAVTYNMNLLQGLRGDTQYCVTLNYSDRIEPSKIIRRFSYDHPVFRRESIEAQSSHADLNAGRTFFCGAYWRNGFHEDGVVSALAALRHFEEATACEKLHFRRAG
jgi:uncharacterized protein